ncbi:MAG: hypothetical protein ACREQ5_16150, partial [Candidatus Dormibacteria bacterium]
QQAYQNLVGQATNVANTPLQLYGGPMVAGFNPTQNAAFGNIKSAQGQAQPYINAGAGFAAEGGAPVWPNVMQYSPSSVGQYESPYTNQVVRSTLNTMNEQNAVQDNQLLGSAIQSGNAFGGDRAGVAQAQLGLNQALASGQTIAGLENQGFAQAQGEFNTQQSTELQGMEGDAWRAANAGYELGGLGTEAEGQTLQGASAELQAGGLGQQLQQEQLDVPYEQFLQEQAYPFQTTQFLGQETGIAAGGAGGTSTTTAPAPSTIGQIAGLGMAGLGLAGMTGGFGPTGYLTGAGGLFSKRGGRIPQKPIELYENGGRVPYDDGGAVDQGPGNPGANAPYMMGANPILQQRYQQVAGQSEEDLERMAVMYPPTSPRGQMVQRALQAKRMAPASNAPASGTPQAPQFSGVSGLPGMVGSTGGGFSGGQQPQGYAAGGMIDPMGLPYNFADPQVNNAYAVPAGPYPGGAPRVRSPVTGESVSNRVPLDANYSPPAFRGIPTATMPADYP